MVCYSLGMSDQEKTVEIRTERVTPRYIVRSLGRRTHGFHHAEEFGAEVVDAWTGDVMTVHWAASAELASLVVEAECAQRNAPMMALEFASKLALHMDRAREVGTDAGSLLEDIGRILDWHIRQLGGLTREPLDVDALYCPAPDFNR